VIDKMRKRFYGDAGVINMGCFLAASIGGALVDRALHPVDTYRDVQNRRATTASRSSEQNIQQPLQQYGNQISFDKRYETEMDPRRVELYLRHIHEGSAKIAEFLNAHSDIKPEFIEDMSAQQEAELKEYSADLDKTQQIEREELSIEE
jgi:hypothetical protein